MVAELRATVRMEAREMLRQAPARQPVRELAPRAAEPEPVPVRAWQPVQVRALAEPARARVADLGTVARGWEALEPQGAQAPARELGEGAAAAAAEADWARVQDPAPAPAREWAAPAQSRESLAHRMASFKQLCSARQTPPRRTPKVPGC